jgi:hypothetical protein
VEKLYGIILPKPKTAHQVPAEHCDEQEGRDQTLLPPHQEDHQQGAGSSSQMAEVFAVWKLA